MKALQVELAARKEYQSGERWVELALVWDTCLVSKEEREEFRFTLDGEGKLGYQGRFVYSYIVALVCLSPLG